MRQSHSSSLIRGPLLVLGALLVTIVAATAISSGQPTRASTAVVMSKTDPTKQPPRGTPETVLHFAQMRDSARILETRDYIYEVYRLAPLVGIDPAFVVAQSALETADWTSFYWTNHLNPAGIGITYTGAPSYTWPSGIAAARFHLARLYVYTAGPIDPGNPLYPYRLDGPDYSHLFELGYDGQAQVIDDLTGRWAVDPNYGQKIANRGNAIFASSASDPEHPAVPVAAIDASAGNDPWRTRDGNIKSTFAVQGIDVPPPGAYITFDLGRPIVLERIQWMFRQAGYADDYDLQTSDDGLTWAVRGTYAAPPINAWLTNESSGTARYVRFLFRNPNGDLNLGFLAEVEFYGVNASGESTATFTPYPSPSSTNTALPTATPTGTPGAPTPTRTPSALPGVQIPVVGSGGSGSATSSKAIWDGLLTTTWQTTSASPPASAQVYVDLGDTGTITGVEFMFRRVNGARLYQIRVSDDKKTWTTVATFDYVAPLTWQRARFTASGRYVQFLFRNPTNAPVLGYLAEVRIFGSLGTFDPSTDPLPRSPTSTSIPSPPASSVPPTATPDEPPQTPVVVETSVASSTPRADTASPVPITNAIPIAVFRRTIASTSSAALTDADLSTTWVSTEPNPVTISITAELHQPLVVGSLAITSGPNGLAGQVDIEVSPDGTTWYPVDADLDPGPFAISSVRVGESVRAIRIVVTNPQSLPEIGGIGDLLLLAPMP